MLTKKTRRIAVVGLVAGVVVPVRIWPDDPSTDRVTVQQSSHDVATAASSAGAARVGGSNTPSATADETPVSRRPKQDPVRLHVRAPSEVRVGDVFQARVDIEANAPVRDLMFSIAYEKSRLSLVGRFEGEFARQRGIPSEFGVDEPSDGNIQVVFRTVNGSAATGVGSIVVLEFEATKVGASEIELQNVRTIDAGGEVNPNVVVMHERRVAIH